VFRNDPGEVAGAFHTHLTGGGAFSSAFERVTFAVWDRSPDSVNRAAFAERFAAVASAPATSAGPDQGTSPGTA
jgi:hypothetical protein